MDSLIFGTAGIPHAAQGEPTQDAIKAVKKLGLGAMEMEFVHSVNISKEKAPLVKKAAEDAGIMLTCHAPFYINLNSPEKAKLAASMHRIIQSAKITQLCGGYSVCFHPGFYLKDSKEFAMNNIRTSMKALFSKLKDEGIKLWVRPETTGKPTQFGNIGELLTLSAEFDLMMPCIDFSHLHARSNGKFNTYDEFSLVLSQVETILGKRGLHNMHCHVAGIAYGEKGEKHHLNLEESDFNYQELMKALADFKVRGVLISESPNIEGDALLMQKAFKAYSS